MMLTPAGQLEANQPNWCAMIPPAAIMDSIQTLLNTTGLAVLAAFTHVPDCVLLEVVVAAYQMCAALMMSAGGAWMT